jgi:hypothetical protein
VRREGPAGTPGQPKQQLAPALHALMI